MSGSSIAWLAFPAAASSQPIVAASARLRIPVRPTDTAAPAVFAAFNTGFLDAGGVRVGNGHCGLLWDSRFPDAQAMNWGVYDETTPAPYDMFPGGPGLPGADMDVYGTFGWRWRAGTDYSFKIARSPLGWSCYVRIADEPWQLVRELYIPATHLEVGNISVFLEEFAEPHGSGPHEIAVWDNITVELADGTLVAPTYATASYNLASASSDVRGSATGGVVLEARATRTHAEGASFSLVAEPEPVLPAETIGARALGITNAYSPVVELFGRVMVRSDPLSSDASLYRWLLSCTLERTDGTPTETIEFGPQTGAPLSHYALRWAAEQAGTGYPIGSNASTFTGADPDDAGVYQYPWEPGVQWDFRMHRLAETGHWRLDVRRWDRTWQRICDIYATGTQIDASSIVASFHRARTDAGVAHTETIWSAVKAVHADGRVTEPDNWLVHRNTTVADWDVRPDPIIGLYFVAGAGNLYDDGDVFTSLGGPQEGPAGDGSYGGLELTGPTYGGVGASGATYGAAGAGTAGSELPAPAWQRDWRLYIRDARGVRWAESDDYTELRATLRHNAISAWTLTGHPASAVGYIDKGWGIALFVRNTEGSAWQLALAGDADTIERQRDDKGIETVTVVGRCDRAIIDAAIAYPDPDHIWTAQTTDYDVRTGDAGTVCTAYLAANLARAEHASRLLTPGGIAGGSVTGRARFDNLAELVFGLAEAGGIGIVSNWTNDGSIYLEPAVLADLRHYVRFSDSLGTLSSYTLTQRRPDVTASLVAGSGEGVARVLVEVGDPSAAAAWGRRVERLRDRRDTADVGKLEASGAEELAGNGDRSSLTAVVLDTEQQRWPRDYGLGCLVTVEVGAEQFIERVRQIELSLTSDGDLVVATVGPPGEPLGIGAAVDRIFARARLLARRVGDLQRI